MGNVNGVWSGFLNNEQVIEIKKICRISNLSAKLSRGEIKNQKERR